MKHLAPKICLSLGVAALTAATAGPVTAHAALASTTTATKAHAPAWHPVLTFKDASTPLNYEAFDAVVATGPRSGWAFLSGAKSTYAYQRTGTATWRKVPFPGKGGEVTVAAGEKDGPVFASYFTGKGSRVYEWTGTKWKLLKSFPGQITGISVLNADDVWFFGGGVGVTHWNGRGWVHVLNSVPGGYALSDTDIWAYNGQAIVHYDGRNETSTDVKKLLPPTGADTMKHVAPYVTAIVALSATDVYATGEGTDYPHGGPMVLLHYNGHAWTRVLTAANSTSPLGQELVPDGKGGVWIPAGDGAENPALFHYTAAGKLTRVTLPGEETYVFPGSSVMSRVPGTAEMLAAGVGYNSSNSKTSPVILEYS